MRTHAIRFTLGMAATLLAADSAPANNLVLTNLTIKPRDDSTAFVKFDIAWNNSWRHTNINHDAAWVFFKVKPEGRSNWEHVSLETNGHVTGTGTPIDIIVPDDRVGCFIRRSGEGSGVLSVTNVKLAWNFASNSLAKTDRVLIQALALEMVYVAEGEFYVGSSGTESGSFTDGGWAGGTNPATPFRITNEAALTITNIAGNLWGTSSSGQNTFGGAGILSNAFPKGYGAFYCMKYEATQGQYRDFLNTLARAQQNTRTATQLANMYAMSGTAGLTGREGIRCPSSVPIQPGKIVFGCDGNNNKIMNETNDAMDRACGYLSPADMCAFADWAGLRPITELEFEKACRGPLTPVANEYPWGDIIVANQTGHAGTDGTGQETATPANANCCYISGIGGPARAGIYAAASSTRQTAGASYWGIMQLGGNVVEFPVTVGSTRGRSFTGLHGDGYLDASGNADVNSWPGTDAAGTGFRGGSWTTTTTYLRISDRYFAAYARGLRDGDTGCRVGRTAPSGVGP